MKRGYLALAALFLVYNGGELHQLYRVASTGCTSGLLPVRFIALCFSHLVALVTQDELLNREGLGLLFVSVQHGLLALLTVTPSNPLLLGIVYLSLGAFLRYFRALSHVLFHVTPFYTSAVKIYQLYWNHVSRSCGMTSQVSTLHILLLSIVYLRKIESRKIRGILVVCLVTNTIQMGQCFYFREQTARSVDKDCPVFE